MITIKEVKKALGINNTDIARMFGYKNQASYANSPNKKKHIENGIIEVFELSKSKLIKNEKNG